jgi:hypothetical protein
MEKIPRVGPYPPRRKFKLVFIDHVIIARLHVL